MTVVTEELEELEKIETDLGVGHEEEFAWMDDSIESDFEEDGGEV